jgi:hypothetical protein
MFAAHGKRARAWCCLVLGIAAWLCGPATGSAAEAESGPASKNGTAALADTPAERNEAGLDAGDKAKLRRREGGKLTDQRGRIERRGERYVFLAENSTLHYIVLENLMLERVATVLDESAGGQLNWNVSGTITEFRGSNYILLQRAVVKSATGTKEPRRLEDPLAERAVKPAAAR